MTDTVLPENAGAALDHDHAALLAARLLEAPNGTRPPDAVLERSRPVVPQPMASTAEPAPPPEPERAPSPDRSRSWLEPVALVGVLAAGLALRVVNIGAVGLNSDEAVYAGQGGALLEVGSFPDHFSIFRAHPLLLQSVVGLAFRIVGPGDTVARATVAVAFGLGSILMAYLLARELYGPKIGVATAAILAVMPYHVVVSRQVLVDTPMAFFAVLGLYLAARSVRTNERSDLYLAFGACALAAISKEIAVLLVPVIAAWMRFGPARVPIRRFIGPSVLYAAICLPFPLTRLVNQPSNASQFFLWQFARSPNHPPDYFLNVLLQFAGYGFVALLVGGLATILLRRSSPDQLIIWWLATFGLFFQFWPTKLFPYLFLVLPAMAIAATVAIDRVVGWMTRPSWRLAAFVAAIGVVTVPLSVGSGGIVLAGPAAELEGFGDFDIEVQTFAGSREFGEWAGHNTPDNARFLTIGPSLGNILRFYGARDSVALSVSPDPLRRNPAYVPIENPDLAMRQMSVHYVVWDAYSADRSAFYNNRLRNYARKLGGEIVFSVWADGDDLVVEEGPPPEGMSVRIVVWDVPGAGSTTGGRREAGLS